MARLDRTLDQIMVLRGELIECRDTIGCRSTLSIKVGEAREFIRRCFGNHHVVVYGDLTRQIKALSQMLGINYIEL